MKINGNTYVSDILKEYGDIADLMELLGTKRIRGFLLRKFLAKFITVKTAAFVHGIPLNNFIWMIENAINQKELVNTVK